MQVGLGRLGLAPSHFWELTMPEFRMAITGYYDAHNAVQRQEWERTRWLAMITITPHVKKGSIKKPQDITRFPWEEEKQAATDGLAILRQMASK